MADRLGVDNVELDDFMKKLKKSTSSLKDLRKALSSATASGLGTSDLDRACEDFQEDWKYGTEQIGKQTEELSKIVKKSKDSYNEVDAALERALEKAAEKGENGGAA